MGEPRPIGAIEAEMGAAAFENKGKLPVGKVETFPAIPPAVFVKLPDIGQQEEGMGEAAFITAKEVENKAG